MASTLAMDIETQSIQPVVGSYTRARRLRLFAGDFHHLRKSLDSTAIASGTATGAVDGLGNVRDAHLENANISPVRAADTTVSWTPFALEPQVAARLGGKGLGHAQLVNVDRNGNLGVIDSLSPFSPYAPSCNHHSREHTRHRDGDGDGKVTRLSRTPLGHWSETSMMLSNEVKDAVDALHSLEGACARSDEIIESKDVRNRFPVDVSRSHSRCTPPALSWQNHNNVSTHQTASETCSSTTLPEYSGVNVRASHGDSESDTDVPETSQLPSDGMISALTQNSESLTTPELPLSESIESRSSKSLSRQSPQGGESHIVGVSSSKSKSNSPPLPSMVAPLPSMVAPLPHPTSTDMCSTWERGTIPANVNCDSDTRSKLEDKLSPQPDSESVASSRALSIGVEASSRGSKLPTRTVNGLQRPSWSFPIPRRQWQLTTTMPRAPNITKPIALSNENTRVRDQQRRVYIHAHSSVDVDDDDGNGVSKRLGVTESCGVPLAVPQRMTVVCAGASDPVQPQHSISVAVQPQNSLIAHANHDLATHSEVKRTSVPTTGASYEVTELARHVASTGESFLTWTDKNSENSPSDRLQTKDRVRRRHIVGDNGNITATPTTAADTTLESMRVSGSQVSSALASPGAVPRAVPRAVPQATNVDVIRTTVTSTTPPGILHRPSLHIQPAPVTANAVVSSWSEGVAASPLEFTQSDRVQKSGAVVKVAGVVSTGGGALPRPKAVSARAHASKGREGSGGQEQKTLDNSHKGVQEPHARGYPAGTVLQVSFSP